MKNKKTPMRRCIGCMESKPKNELIRVAFYEGVLNVDPTGKAKGRGVYICPDAGCLEKAGKKNLFRKNFSAEISGEQIDSLFGELRKYEKKDR